MTKVVKWHKPGDCELQDGRCRLCTNHATYKMTRVDGTTNIVCRWCAKRLKVLSEKHPETFNELRFAAISPADQLTKY